MRGSIVRGFESFVDPQVPIQYDFPITQERTGWMVEVSAGRAFPLLTVNAGYRHRADWDRYGLNRGLDPMLFEGLKEDAGFACLSCSLSLGRITITDSSVIEYDRILPDVPYVPKYRVLNGVRIVYRSLLTAVGLQYFSERTAFHNTLPAVTLLDARVGFRIRALTLFCAIYNIGDRRSEMYGCICSIIKPRTFAAGLEFSRP